MKKLALLFAFVCTSVLLFAQTTATTPIEETKKERKAATFKKGDVLLNAGVGVIPTYINNKNTTALMPPLSLTLGYRMGDHFLMSAFVGMTKAESYLPQQADGTNWYVKNQSTVVGLRAEFHTARRDNFDIYGGVMAGYSQPNIERTLLSIEGHDGTVLERETPASEYDGPTPFRPGSESAGKMLFSGFVGGAWYFTPKMNVFGEVGYGVSIATIGLGYKF